MFAFAIIKFIAEIKIQLSLNETFNLKKTTIPPCVSEKELNNRIKEMRESCFGRVDGTASRKNCRSLLGGRDG